MLKDILSKLNTLQLSHLREQGKCRGRICELPDCTNCLCGLRNDAKFCCALHRSEANNQKSDKRNKQIRKNKKINEANSLKINHAWERGFHVFKYDFLHHIDFDFSVEPISIIINGKRLAAYDRIGMWSDAEGNYHLERI